MSHRQDEISLDSLKRSTKDRMSFDPLGIAAILHNPRALSSAARLYSQCEPGIKFWTHTLMLGGALVPFKLFATHLLPKASDSHPAMDMFTQATSRLQVRSNFGFNELPMDPSNYWVQDAISSSSSSQLPQHDVHIFRVPDSNGKLPKQSLGPNVVLSIVSVSIGAISATGIWYSIFADDIWGIALFSAYTSHWTASIVIGVICPVRIRNIEIKEDTTPKYAVYQRPVTGGIVIFKGYKETLEKWTRRTWGFHASLQATIVHWIWLLTGSACATASVVCMVNMESGNQLIFIALLMCSSLGEIASTRAAATARALIRNSNDSIVLQDNDFRTRGIIRATLEAPDALKVTGLRWIEDADIFPDWSVYSDLQAVLDRIGKLDASKDWNLIQEILENYVEKADPAYKSIAMRVQSEILDVCKLRSQRPSEDCRELYRNADSAPAARIATTIES